MSEQELPGHLLQYILKNSLPPNDFIHFLDTTSVTTFTASAQWFSLLSIIS